MIFNLLQIALVLSNTFVISAYASGLELNNGSDASCRDALTQSSEASALEAYIIELQYVISEYNKLPPSTNGYSDERRAYIIELVEAFDRDISEVSIILDIPEADIGWLIDNEKTNGSQVTNIESYIVSSYEHTDKDRVGRVQALIDEFYNVRIVRDREIESIVSEFNSITNPLERGRVYSANQSQLAIKLVKKTDGNVTEAARLLKIPQPTLYNWIREHEEIRNIQIRNARNTDNNTYGRYLKEQKAIAIQLAIELGNTAEAARYLGMIEQTLRNWVNNYRNKLHAQPNYKPLDRFSDEDKETMIEWAMDSGNVAEIAETVNTDSFDLNRLVRNYKRKHGMQTRSAHFDE